MVPEVEKPRVTEIHVRMDCNGCIQKIKKALHGINGIYDIYIDFPQQKLTVVGWADPEKILKAIKKTRKIATICSHSEPSEPPPLQTQEQTPEGAPPGSNGPNPPPQEAPPSETTPPLEPPKDPPTPPPENPNPEPTPPPVTPETPLNHHGHSSRPKDVEEIHVIYHHPPEYGHSYSHGYGGHWNNYSNSVTGFRHEPPTYVTHSYSTYKPSPYIAEYEYVRSPPRHTGYIRTDHYSEDYRNHGNSNGNNITSMFSDENPNACTIV